MSNIDLFKLLTPAVAAGISLWALCNSYRTNRHKDNFAIAQEKYFDLLVKTIPSTFNKVEYASGGNIKQETTINFLKKLDNLRDEIDHLVIVDNRKYKKIISKLDLIDNNISFLSTAVSIKDFKATKEWKQIISDLRYIVKTLLLNV